MGEYPKLDPYSRSRYDHGVDSKIVIMGNSGVGKTSLLYRYTQNRFEPKNNTATSGAFFVTKKVHVNGVKVRLQLWDTAGQERFRSMAPMYYRGANAALLLYDITNASTFDDIRGWLEELKKNCPPELIIYIVGSKADLHHHRQVTPDLARLSLHNWFPPPRPPTPPPPPQPSTLSYIRPRFTSLPGLLSPTFGNSTNPSTPSPSSPDAPEYLDLPSGRPSALQRRVSAQSKPKTASSLTRSNSSNGTKTPQSSRFGPRYNGYNDNVDNSSNSIEEVDEDTDDDTEWGLSKGMELFEVSAKDDTGISHLFEHLISAIILRKDVIERENDLKKRDSVFLDSMSTPSWSNPPPDELESEKPSRFGSWNCC
ncbi:P-loop containing nucleoside triphosphate hydrolase protein [Crepidotus variabilis]|uniref:P-loop containing nucleoside triphosphate hydrolase protein n=1 Tax=Crepidotus variabilis TaxID=179855 RepID=A0A9P6JV43_9AGAR|nr:P-loop containing nucleoside triphosphate hydrolase protein [Crepidotus variabilis]